MDIRSRTRIKGRVREDIQMSILVTRSSMPELDEFVEEIKTCF